MTLYTILSVVFKKNCMFKTPTKERKNSCLKNDNNYVQISWDWIILTLLLSDYMKRNFGP
jgi:hypothetical protein